MFIFEMKHHSEPGKTIFHSFSFLRKTKSEKQMQTSIHILNRMLYTFDSQTYRCYTWTWYFWYAMLVLCATKYKMILYVNFFFFLFFVLFCSFCIFTLTISMFGGTHASIPSTASQWMYRFVSMIPFSLFSNENN